MYVISGVVVSRVTVGIVVVASYKVVSGCVIDALVRQSMVGIMVIGAAFVNGYSRYVEIVLVRGVTEALDVVVGLIILGKALFIIRGDSGEGVIDVSDFIVVVIGQASTIGEWSSYLPTWMATGT